MWNMPFCKVEKTLFSNEARLTPSGRFNQYTGIHVKGTVVTEDPAGSEDPIPDRTVGSFLKMFSESKRAAQLQTAGLSIEGE
jgi:hypothetical protein